MKVFQYKVTVNHDNGTIRIYTAAQNQEACIDIIMKAEKCPRRAIVKVERV